MRSWLKALTVVQIVAASASSLAQAGPDQFFPRDHAKSGGLVAKQQEGRGIAHSSRYDMAPDAATKSDTFANQPEGFVEMGDLEQEEQLLAADDSLSGIPIQALGAILSTADQELLEKQFRHLIEIAFKRDIPLAAVYAVGEENPYVRGDNYLMSAMWILGGSLVGLPAIPAPYDQFVTQAPSWIIFTERGQFVLEGVAAPEKYISASGKYIDRVDLNLGLAGVEKTNSAASINAVRQESPASASPNSAIEAARRASLEETRRLIDSMTEKNN